MSKNNFKASSLKPFGVDVAGLEPDAMIERKYFTPEVKLMESEEKTIIAKISCHDIDADGDLVYASGCDMSRYQKNPVVMFAHDYTQAPVAKATELRITAEGVEAKIVFADTQRANDMWSLVKGGFLRAHSVGFITRKQVINGTKEFKDFESVKSLTVGANCKRIVTEWLLLEDSLVPIPSNPSALTEAISMKSIAISDETKLALDIKTDPNGFDGDKVSTIISAPADNAQTVNLAINDAVNLFSLNKPIQICSDGHIINFTSGKEFMDSTEEYSYADEKEVKPYENQHSFRINDPSKYTKFRRQNNAFGEGIDVIYGITSGGKAEVQSIRFRADKFTMEEARTWIKRHNYKPSETSHATGTAGKMEAEKAPIAETRDTIVSNPEPITETAFPNTTTNEGPNGDDGAEPKSCKAECMMCGKEFETEKASHRFCSKDCFHKYLRERVKRVAGKALDMNQIETMEQDDIEGKAIESYIVIRPTEYVIDEETKAKIKAEVELELRMLKAGKVF